MSLVRIPCILVAAVGLHVGATPPTPPPSQDDKQMRNRIEDGVLTKRSLPYFVKSIAWGAALAESAVIMANRHRETEIARVVLSKLAPGGNVMSITPTTMAITGGLLAGLGGFIRWKCYRELGRFFTFEMVIRKDHTLITSGPYSIVRHPGYTGALLAIAGTVAVHACPGSWARECGIIDTAIGRLAAGAFLLFTGFIGSGLMVRMPKEDQALREAFGMQWEKWARDVPYRLVPWII